MTGRPTVHNSPAVQFTTLGIDVGDRKSHVRVLDPAGEVSHETTVPTTPDGVAALMKVYQGARVAYEVGTHTYQGMSMTHIDSPQAHGLHRLALLQIDTIDLNRQPTQDREVVALQFATTLTFPTWPSS